MPLGIKMVVRWLGEDAIRSPRMIWAALARAIAGTGTDQHVERLIDLIGAARAAGSRHRDALLDDPACRSSSRIGKFSDEMVQRYLEIYYVYDPFYAFWRRHRRPGVVPLKSFADDDVKRGRYMAEFLAQSVICDEVGVLLEDGRAGASGSFSIAARSVQRAPRSRGSKARFPVFAALHALDIQARRAGLHAHHAGRRRRPPAAHAIMPQRLWPELSTRERQLVGLILAGHPTARSPSGSASPSERSRTIAAASTTSSTSPPSANCSCSISTTTREAEAGSVSAAAGGLGRLAHRIAKTASDANSIVSR